MRELKQGNGARRTCNGMHPRTIRTTGALVILTYTRQTVIVPNRVVPSQVPRESRRNTD
jgi:hypothetical protein